MALAWLSSFWEQARAICIQVVDSIRESLSAVLKLSKICCTVSQSWPR